LTATSNASQQQQRQHPNQPLLYSHHHTPADVAAAAGQLASHSQSAAAAAAAAALSSDDEECINEEDLCVVCWVGQRSVALVHGADAHLVSNTAAPAAAWASHKLRWYLVLPACCC
jgi:hypothetical protein